MDRNHLIRPLLDIYIDVGTILIRYQVPEILNYHKIWDQEAVGWGLSSSTL
jgi:hypothetical protein